MVSCKKMLGYRVGAFAIYQSVEIQYTQKHGWQKSTISSAISKLPKSPSNTFLVDQYSTFVYVWFPYVWYFVKPQHAIKTFIFRKPSINGVHFPAKVTARATTNIRIVTNSFWYHAHFFPSIQRRRSLCLDNDDDYYITNHWQLVYKHFLMQSHLWLVACLRPCKE